jgi:2-polyprenyl-3-methyl-5-hydroxy-6-metoxy-1,4-benzoquinol methylase
MSSHAAEVAAGERFEFGANWSAFLRSLDERRIGMAERSVRDLLEVSTLQGKRFLDVGCGSGLFSLAAKRLGARVYSLDYDPQSVTCTGRLRHTYFRSDSDWVIEEGSVLDEPHMERLGHFDIVYSWGVLHHTGALWRAVDLASRRVAPGGVLAIALYNDQGWKSALWRRIKRVYCSSAIGRMAVCGTLIPYLAARAVVASLVKYGNLVSYFTTYGRGMSVYHDWKDWLGGYPFEVAKPEAVLAFLRPRGFTLEHLRTVTGVGCNEYVFAKQASRT